MGLGLIDLEAIHNAVAIRMNSTSSYKDYFLCAALDCTNVKTWGHRAPPD
jgi:hypothetical protein